ncbi:MAG: hypothetical protein NTW28_05790 [Candidatus Solibacter sp.]|nr:hypothetical protein [Candidatus Solibacter sp.]
MRFLLAFLVMAAAFAQPPAPQAKPAEVTAPAKADEKAVTPVPSSEPWITGSFDFGYRWVGDVRGSDATYRSIVNLGDGPKLTGMESPTPNTVCSTASMPAPTRGAATPTIRRTCRSPSAGCTI